MDKPIIVKGKVFKSGNSYGVRIQKALVDSQVFNEGDEIILQYVPERKSSGTDKKDTHYSPVVSKSYTVDSSLKPYNIRNFLDKAYKDSLIMV